MNFGITKNNFARAVSLLIFSWFSLVLPFVPIKLVFSLSFVKYIMANLAGVALFGYGAFALIVMLPLTTPLTKSELRFSIAYIFVLLIILCALLLYNTSSLSSLYNLMWALFSFLIGLFLFQRLAFYWALLLYGEQTNLVKMKATPTNFYIGQHVSAQLCELNYSYVVDSKSYDLRLLCGKSRNGKQMKKINAVRYNVRNPAKSIVWIER